MRCAIRHHGVAVANAAGDVAIAGQRGGGLLRTGCIERGLVLVAGHRADLTGRARLPHAPDLHAGSPRLAPRSARSGIAARAGRALGAFRSLHTLRALWALWSGNAGLAARARRPLRTFRSRHTRRALRSGKTLEPLQTLEALDPLRSAGARRSGLAAWAGRARLTLRPARGAIRHNGLALDIAGFEGHGAIHRVVGEAKREATISVAAGGVMIVGRHHGAGPRCLPRDHQFARLDCGDVEADAGATVAVPDFPVQPGISGAVLRIVVG